MKEKGKFVSHPDWITADGIGTSTVPARLGETNRHWQTRAPYTVAGGCFVGAIKEWVVFMSFVSAPFWIPDIIHRLSDK